MSRISFYAVLGLMAGCGAAVSMGSLDPNINLDSARQIWSDVVRDVDEFGLHATRISAHREMELGAEMAARLKTWGPEDVEESKYVAAVADQLVPNVNRKAMRYQVHVVPSPQINAFALPGGQIYVMTGMLNFLESESEVAAVLGHEMSHVDLRHCVERYQYELALKKVGAGNAADMVEMAHRLVAMGYNQDQELDADASGERLVIDAGYDPDAARAVFERMKAKFGEHASTPANTPIGEVGQAVWEALGSYFQTHPPSEQRARQLAEMVARNRGALGGRVMYRGIRNFKERIPRSRQEFDAERHIY